MAHLSTVINAHAIVSLNIKPQPWAAYLGKSIRFPSK
jgi:hypothetical protein